MHMRLPWSKNNRKDSRSVIRSRSIPFAGPTGAPGALWQAASGWLRPLAYLLGRHRTNGEQWDVPYGLTSSNLSLREIPYSFSAPRHRWRSAAEAKDTGPHRLVD